VVLPLDPVTTTIRGFHRRNLIPAKNRKYHATGKYACRFSAPIIAIIVPVFHGKL
jgi:hypothetical protein